MLTQIKMKTNEKNSTFAVHECLLKMKAYSNSIIENIYICIYWGKEKL